VLDSLRGISALLIAVYHFSPRWDGCLALDFFFLLSGFVLSHTYSYRKQPITMLNFAGRRLARLYPYHIITLLAFVLVQLSLSYGLPSYKDETLVTFIQHLTLTKNIGLNPNGLTWNYLRWSTSVEFWINFLFIFLVSKMTRSIVILFVALAGLIVIYANTGHLETQAANYCGFLNSEIIRGMSGFLLGILTYRIHLRFKDNNRWLAFNPFIKAIALVGVVIVLFTRSGKLSELYMIAPFVFMLLVVSFANESGFLTKWLSKLHYLGTISYSLYLNQILVGSLIWYWIPSLHNSFYSRLAVFLLVLLIVSHFTYRFVERSLRNLGRKVLPT
jgi:peptidoglycan/LPS O-acetylase OafA/YrhL